MRRTRFRGMRSESGCSKTRIVNLKNVLIDKTGASRIHEEGSESGRNFVPRFWCIQRELKFWFVGFHSMVQVGRLRTPDRGFLVARSMDASQDIFLLNQNCQNPLHETKDNVNKNVSERGIHFLKLYSGCFLGATIPVPGPACGTST